MADEPPTEPSGRPDPDILAAVAGNNRPKDDKIRERAYLIWVNEGHPHGREIDHWLRAKWELERESDQHG